MNFHRLLLRITQPNRSDLASSFVSLILMSMTIVDVEAVTPRDVASNLTAMGTFCGRATVEVQLPMSNDNEIKYSIDLLSIESENDSLSPVSYLIDWTLPTPMGVSHGFTSYFNGNLYRFRDGAPLQEYHFDKNPDPFLVSAVPVQKGVQFLDILPVYVGEEINNMLDDSTFTVRWWEDTVFNGSKVNVLKARRIVNDLEVGNWLIVLNPETDKPILVEKEMSPGSVGEQTVIVRYDECAFAKTLPLSEEQLVDLYPQEFSNFRQDSWKLERLVGKNLPGFSLPMSDGSRFSHSKGETLSSPSIFVFLEENLPSTPQFIEDLRQTVAALPFNVDIYWIFLSNRLDEIAETVGRTFPGEVVLTSGRNITKDFGVTVTPSTLLASRQGEVLEIIQGLNNDLQQIVIDKMTLTK